MAALLGRSREVYRGDVRSFAMATFGPVHTDDRVVRAEWGRWAARERLAGAPVVELPGGHSPFVSRTGDLADVLVQV